MRLFVKGATEAIVVLCTEVIGEDGNKVEFTDEIKETILGNDGILKSFAK